MDPLKIKIIISLLEGKGGDRKGYFLIGRKLHLPESKADIHRGGTWFCGTKPEPCFRKFCNAYLFFIYKCAEESKRNHGNSKKFRRYKGHEITPVLDVSGSEDPGDEDFQSDENQNHTAENSCSVCKLGSKFFADDQTRIADAKGSGGNDQGTDESHDKTIISDGKSDR